MNLINWIAIFPEIYLLISLLVMLIYGSFAKNNKNTSESTSSLEKYYNMGIMLLILCILLVSAVSYISIDLFSNLLTVSPVISTIKILLLSLSVLIMLVCKRYVLRGIVYNYEYVVVLLSAILGLSILLSANDFIMVFVAYEFATLPFFILGLNRKYSLGKIQAILKYFILSLVASALFLYGVSLLYGFTGTTSFVEVRDFLSQYKGENLMLDLGILMIISAFAFKLSLAPFHMWSVDIYDKLDYSLTLILNTIYKLCFAFVLLRMLWGPFYSSIAIWGDIICIISILSIVIGYVGAIYQRNIIKIIAFSGVVQMGFIALIMMFKTELSLHTFIIFMAVYIMSNIGIFAILIALSNQGKKLTTIDDLKNLSSKHPVYAFMLSLFFLSIAGLPPLGGFFTKLLVIYILITHHYYVISLSIVVISLLGMFYYIRIVKYIYTKNSDDNQNTLLKIMNESKANVISSLHLVLIICFIFVSGLFIWLKPINVILSKLTFF